MDKLVLTGGARLEGTIVCSGSKNSALAIMAGALLGVGETTLHNVPAIGDVETMMQVLHTLGVRCEWQKPGTMLIDATEIKATEAPYELVQKMRAAFCVLGGVLARKGYAKVAMPGGCDIGARPIDFHVKGISSMGAHVNTEGGFVEAEADELVGAEVYLNFPSAGATQHVMTAACLAKGTTTIHNAATEPEVVQLAAFLTKMGASVRGAGTNTVIIQGVEELRGVEFEVVPDRMEAGTFAVAAAATQGDVHIERVRYDHLEPFVLKLRETGAIVDVYEDAMRVRGNARPMATDIMTMPHPGFPTDLQQPFAALLATADGTSVITENVYERRFRYINELLRMGADVKQQGRAAVITGAPKLTGTKVVATDLRGGAALVCAALTAEGQTEISGLDHIGRGYERIVEKLRGLGAQIGADPTESERESVCV